ncbi:MAG: glycoside-pentoside-hexuronide (GPH):cation symporter [Treponema sp.]|jgi:GPH family glycoside/pentoside/hexuronide:cation symporter|nr:glycoside-pentoside-hexuronide (GPH):cation symporter [Treponema sp.]
MGEKGSLRSKFAYGASDLASNLSFGAIGSFLMIYYTDVIKIPAAAVGMMFLITRIWDAVNDPMMGIVIDKTHTRWGKSRPYFLWMCLPLAIMMVLTYSVPAGFSDSGKLVYVYTTFILLTMVYTAINIPVTSILPRLTTDLQDRTVYGVFRSLGGLIGNVIVMSATVPLAAALGAGQPAKGYRLTMTVYAAIALLLFLFVFFNLKELSLDEGKKAKLKFAESVGAAKGNLPWLIILAAGLLLQMHLAMRSAALVYYCKYYLNNEGLVPFAGMLMLLMVFPMMLLPVISKKMGKRNTVILGGFISGSGFLIIWLGGTLIPVFFVGNILSIIGLAFALGLLFVLTADTVDYGEYKNGVRSEGFLSAAASFGQKMGVGLGGAAAAFVLSAGGYSGEAEVQMPSAIRAIQFNYVFLPWISFVLVIILMCFYKLDKIAPRMMAELEERRSKSWNPSF